MIEAIVCLAMNVYHEARGEPLDGQLAVAQVTMNRVESERFPDSVCDVVYQGHRDARGNMIRNKCQFSWYCDGRDDRPYNKDEWDASMDVATAVLTPGGAEDLVGGAMWYHADYVDPYWAPTMTKTAKIGVHIFYK